MLKIKLFLYEKHAFPLLHPVHVYGILTASCPFPNIMSGDHGAIKRTYKEYDDSIQL